VAIERRVDSTGRIRYGVKVYSPTTGKRSWLGTFDRKKDAEAVEAEARRRARMGESPERRDIAFDALADEWVATRAVRASTLYDYERAAEILKDRLGHKAASMIEPHDVAHLAADLSRDYSAAYTRKIITRLRQILICGVRWGYLARNVAEQLENLPRMKRQRDTRPLEAEEARALVAAAPEYWRPTFAVWLATGLRRSEIFGLTWDDVDLLEGTVRVRRQLVGGRLVDPKTEAARRTITLGEHTAETLRQHYRTCPESELDLVFPTPHGAPVTHSNFRTRVWIPTAEAAGLSWLTPHGLRHSYASRLVDQGANPKDLQYALGHTSSRVSLEIYTHRVRGGGNEAARKLDEWLHGG
jgi:integrase